jgi:hypothetical protein
MSDKTMAGYEHRPQALAAIVMVIEGHIAREQTCQIPLLGIDRALRLAGHLRCERAARRVL